MNDREWVDKFVNAWVFRCGMKANVGYENVSKVLKAFRAEVLKEAEENTWNWLIGLSSDNFPMSREKLHSAILGDHVPGVTKMIDCPACGRKWDVSRFNSCQCGASIENPPPPDILMDARQEKLHVDMPGRRSVKTVFRPDAEKIGPAIQALLEENHHGIDCHDCAESVDGDPGGACCGQCREEEER